MFVTDVILTIGATFFVSFLQLNASRDRKDKIMMVKFGFVSYAIERQLEETLYIQSLKEKK